MELVLQGARFFAESEVDPSPELAIYDLAVTGQMRLPCRGIVTDEIVHFAICALAGFDDGTGILAQESQGDCVTAIAVPGERENHFLPRQVETDPAAAREVAHPPVHLSRVLLEGDR
ncbi:MAG: hypothetical protein ACJ781_00580 [Myxococcales bacterium]